MRSQTLGVSRAKQAPTPPFIPMNFCILLHFFIIGNMLFYVLEHLEMSKKCHRSYGKHLKIMLIAQDDQKPQKTLSQANRKKKKKKKKKYTHISFDSIY